MRKIVIGFSKPIGFFKPFSWVIRAVDGTHYSHVYIRVRSEQLDVDLIYQASGTQVNFMGISHFQDHAKSLYEFEVDITDDRYRQFMRWAIVNSGADYSLKQAIGILAIKMFNLNRNPFSTGQKSWVCSELAGYVLSTFIDANIDGDLDVITPRHIFEICNKNLKQIEVYNGK